MRYIYNSPFAGKLEQFIAQKHALGFPYKRSEKYLRSFDKMCGMQFPHIAELNREIATAWGQIRMGEKRCSFVNRIAPVREFAKFLIRSGETAYIIEPIDVPKKERKRIPHIFTDRELELFFAAADTMAYNERAKIRHLIIAVIFRLMYSCGLRPIEAIMVKRSDIDFKTRTLRISNSKQYKDRMVMLSPDVSDLCERYLRITQNRFPDSDYLFPNWKIHEHLNSHWLNLIFHDIWNDCGITESSGASPIPYDFRHSFATKRLYAWHKEGKNINAMIPYLSAYMGHAHISYTAYYIHLVPEFFPQMERYQGFARLLPEVDILL